jgi:hypothetical protein
MRTGIEIEVTGDDRARLEAIVADRNRGDVRFRIAEQTYPWAGRDRPVVVPELP